MCDLDGCTTNQDWPLPGLDDNKRRLFLKGLGSLPLATVLAYPVLTQAAAGRLEAVSTALPEGTSVSAALARPDATKAPAVILIHEWWGLNDQIKSVAADLADAGYLALAIDLYGGGVASNPDGAMSLMKSVDPAVATATLTRWVDWLRNHSQSSGKVATMGWCFGGGWSLNASIATPVDATVIYYGQVTQPAEKLKSLHGPVLGHFGTLDKNINKTMVNGFEMAMQKAGKADNLTIYWYEADHAFANPTGARYDSEDAALAWQRTQNFLGQNLM
ncbi:MAG: hypothetical protein DHS20C01_30610 [marine bacterium B5-7]|nr:MAG: hypothetical protein DHS20C01_30610 [marine bacterium B5-7]